MNRPEPTLAQIVDTLRSQVQGLGHPIRMLIVDDELNDLLLVKKAIEKAAPTAQMDMAMSHEEALTMLRCPQPYDLILIDLRMPGQSGVDLIDAIHQSNIPGQILCMSGMDNGPLVSESVKRGALVHIRKSHLNEDVDKLFAWKQNK